ncbi:hypothetical protein CkaCkLH20_10764 [Colletotrichum karsti]|uniref:Uncharacterized protein n=1 Tax=Colletotrichum karsti TaxID=1095194 RepID=A0A9P6LGQ8_9PEZI|nr:uncharacterized protein CkaCkLH20_10764 [Colletotrichum karsti]KAF9871830.1 hypothetical protein CkaCkLH20_10764 [Colletotrichum karsti]
MNTTNNQLEGVSPLPQDGAQSDEVTTNDVEMATDEEMESQDESGSDEENEAEAESGSDDDDDSVEYMDYGSPQFLPLDDAGGLQYGPEMQMLARLIAAGGQFPASSSTSSHQRHVNRDPFNTKWFDIKWSEREDYYVPEADCPWDIPSRPTFMPQSKLGDSRWPADKISARGEELCSVELDTIPSWDLAALYQRMTDLDEVLGHIKDDWPVKRVEISSKRFRVSVIPDNEEGCHLDLARRLLRQHDAIRDIVQERSRPYVKNTRFEDLSFDLYHQIINYCRIMPSKYALGENCGLDLIKSFRLTCKALNEIASPLLIRGVTVHLTTESLERLEYISKHPLLSKGVSHVGLRLDYYVPEFQDPLAFTLASAFHLRSLLEETDYEGEGLLNKVRIGAEFIEGMLDSWIDLAKEYPSQDQEADMDAVKRDWANKFAEVPFLLDAHRAYVDKVKDYEKTLEDDGDFLCRVADAVARMPLCKALTLSDHDTDAYESASWLQKYRPSQILEHGPMLDLLTSPKIWNCMAGWPGQELFPEISQPPVHILSEIFPALGARGVRLRAVDIQVSAPFSLYDLEIEDDEARQDFSKCMTDVLYLTVKIRRPQVPEMYAWVGNETSWPPRDEQELSLVDSFLDALLSTEKLQDLKLNFQSLQEENEHIPGSWYFPSLFKMETRKWPSERKTSLKHVCLSSIGLADFLADGEIDLKDVYMAEGTWTEALDIMRQRHKPRSETETQAEAGGRGVPRFSANVVEVRGAEAETMYNEAYEEWRMAFTNAFRGRGLDPFQAEGMPSPPPDTEWRARRYVNHQRDENPCRAFL